MTPQIKDIHPEKNLITANKLVIGYGSKPIGHAFDLHLNANEVVCLLGPNGSGKSTLFKSIMGLIRPLSGQLHILGKPVQNWSRKTFARSIGYVPQAHEGTFPFSVEEVVLMGRTAHIGRYSSPGSRDKHLVAQCLDKLNILHLRNRLYPELSGGEQQLTLIARALAQEPAILLMDEPTASLDFGNQIRVLEQIQQLKNAGITILLCTHQPEHALHIADRVALFRDGTIHHYGTPEKIMTRHNLAWLYNLRIDQVPASLEQSHE